MFQNIYNIDRENKPLSNSGCKTRPNYKPTYDSDGKYKLEESGVINTYDDIQSHHDSCDLEQIIAKYNMTGNAELLNKRHGFYLDISEYPQTPAEMQNLMIQAEGEFNALPKEIKSRFNYNVREYFAELGTEGFKEKHQMPKIEDKDVIIKTEGEVANDSE